MQNNRTHRKGYVLAAFGGATVGAVAGGIIVALLTKAFPKIVGAMRDMMSN